MYGGLDRSNALQLKKKKDKQIEKADKAKRKLNKTTVTEKLQQKTALVYEFKSLIMYFNQVFFVFLIFYALQIGF